jgi:hypothetical protein
MQISKVEVQMLRDIYKKSGELLDRLGFGLDGDASERKAIKKEPTSKQRLNNYLEILTTGKKNSKPRHLQK